VIVSVAFNCQKFGAAGIYRHIVEVWRASAMKEKKVMKWCRLFKETEHRVSAQPPRTRLILEQLN